jgi:hypothetical protein
LVEKICFPAFPGASRFTPSLARNATRSAANAKKSGISYGERSHFVQKREAILGFPAQEMGISGLLPLPVTLPGNPVTGNGKWERPCNGPGVPTFCP